MKNKIVIFIMLTQVVFASESYYYKNNQKITLTPIKSIERSCTNIDYYENNQNIILGVTDKLIVKLINSKYLNEILKKFDLTLVRILSRDMYLLKTINKSVTINISNRLTQEKYVEYAHPDFMKKNIRR